MRPFGVIVLAAGGSRRLGRPKQLVAFEGETLVARAAREAVGSDADQVVVVVGSNAEAVAAVLAQVPVQVVINEQWEEGMASSIRAGVLALRSDLEAVVVMTCDQLSVHSGHVGQLATRCLADEKVVASTYEGVRGIPCAFPRAWFRTLSTLGGDMGARGLIRSAHDVALVELPDGGRDVDTSDDAAKCD